jgi:hypothetical protein
MVVHKAWNDEVEMVNTKNVLVEERTLEKLFVALRFNNLHVQHT